MNRQRVSKHVHVEIVRRQSALTASFFTWGRRKRPLVTHSLPVQHSTVPAQFISRTSRPLCGRRVPISPSNGVGRPAQGANRTRSSRTRRHLLRTSLLPPDIWGLDDWWCRWQMGRAGGGAARLIEAASKEMPNADIWWRSEQVTRSPASTVRTNDACGAGGYDLARRLDQPICGLTHTRRKKRPIPAVEEVAPSRNENKGPNLKYNNQRGTCQGGRRCHSLGGSCSTIQYSICLCAASPCLCSRGRVEVENH